MRLRLSISVFLVLVWAVGCTQQSQRTDESPLSLPSSGVVCTEIYVAGLIVEVRDAATGAPAAFGARGEIRDGTYLETLEVEGGRTVAPDEALRLVGAWERPGQYEVVVSKDGYQDWTAVTMVDADQCHVQPVTLQAALTK